MGREIIEYMCEALKEDDGYVRVHANDLLEWNDRLQKYRDVRCLNMRTCPNFKPYSDRSKTYDQGVIIK